MLFRYKITKSTEYEFSSLTRIHYDVRIEYYNARSTFFPWKHFHSTTLKAIVQKYTSYNFLPYTDGINEVYNFISKYENMDQIMEKYITDIKKEKDIENQNNQKSIDRENMIDEFILLNKWNTIEIKEND
jgi:hypothetical protein